MNKARYRLRSISFKQVTFGLIDLLANKEPLNRPFVIVSALTYNLTFANLDVNRFIPAFMGFSDRYVFLKKMSLLPVVGPGGESAISQLWLHEDLTEFEIDSDVIVLSDVIDVDIQYPIVHILELLDNK